MSGRIYNSMSKNRKIFNLFKFIDELYFILKINESREEAIYLRFFNILAHSGALVYYVLDNVQWMVNTKILSTSH